jgi:hypothetical protein
MASACSRCSTTNSSTSIRSSTGSTGSLQVVERPVPQQNAVAQWKAGEKLVVGDDKILDIEDPRFDAKNPPLFSVNLTEIDEYAMKLIELMIQAGSTEVGIVGPDDGGMAGMDSTKLATGIKSLERTGNLLMKFTETDHADAITAILDQAVDIILEHMDEDRRSLTSPTPTLLQSQPAGNPENPQDGQASPHQKPIDRDD